MAKTLGGFCQPVHACLTTGCDHKRAGAPNETSYCAIHECVEQDCHEKALKPGAYCQAYHACGEDDCPCRRSNSHSTTKYCASHECKDTGCNKKGRDVGGFCVQFHACGYAACLNRRADTLAEASYCLLHECKDLQCNQQARGPGGYCDRSHACGTASCMERRSGSPVDAKFCTTHECKHSDCRAESNVPGGYCSTNRHACQKHECKEPRRDNGSGKLCASHHIEQLEEELKREKPSEPMKTNSPLTKGKEARSGEPQSKDQLRNVTADGKALKGSVNDQSSNSSVMAQAQDHQAQSPRVETIGGFTPIIMLMPPDFMGQVKHWVNPLHLFRTSGNENRPETPQRRVSWTPRSGADRGSG
jgi:hypothetical protein